MVGLSRYSTAGSQTSPEVGDKGKPGESRRRKATRLTRATARHASRAADSHYRGGRSFMRAFILAVTGLAFGVTACSSGGTSVVEIERASVASVSLVLPAPSLLRGQTGRASATPRDATGIPLLDRAVTWRSSASSIASVTDSGVISAVA